MLCGMPPKPLHWWSRSPNPKNLPLPSFLSLFYLPAPLYPPMASTDPVSPAPIGWREDRALSLLYFQLPHTHTHMWKASVLVLSMAGKERKGVTRGKKRGWGPLSLPRWDYTIGRPSPAHLFPLLLFGFEKMGVLMDPKASFFLFLPFWRCSMSMKSVDGIQKIDGVWFFNNPSGKLLLLSINALHDCWKDGKIYLA